MTIKHIQYAAILLSACIGSLTSAFAAVSGSWTAPPIRLRGEVAVQYSQFTGFPIDIDGGTEICVQSTEFEATPTGNAQHGFSHCHSLLTQPVHLDVQLNSGKLNVPVTAVGNKQLGLAGIVDTGSGGVTLNAFQIFPAGMVTASGFNFNGENQIVYEGITVTKLVATRGYGGESSKPTTRTGNLGFAHITFGEKGVITTALVPILFVYTSTTQPTATSGDLDNTIGINGGMDAIGKQISFDGTQTKSDGVDSTTVVSECTKQSTTQCSLISPFRELSYSQGLQAGYILENFPLIDGQKGRYLTIGLDQHNTKGFASTQLQCATSSLAVESCNQEVRDVNIATSAGLTFTWNVIFDSGRGTIGLTVPVDRSSTPSPTSLPENQTVIVTPPNQNGYTYSFTTGTGFAATTLSYVNINADDAAQTYSNMGLEFFANNSLMLDYDNGVEGWEQASNPSR